MRTSWCIARSILAGLLVLAATAVGKAAEKFPLRTLAKGAFSGITNRQQLVITNQQTWQAFWAKHNVEVKPAEKLPKVDFDKEMVVAIALGIQRSGGYRIEIVAAEPEANKLKIVYKRYAPPPNGINLQVITSPFHFVAVPKSELKPEFAEVEK